MEQKGTKGSDNSKADPPSKKGRKKTRAWFFT